VAFDPISTDLSKEGRGASIHLNQRVRMLRESVPHPIILPLGTEVEGQPHAHANHYEDNHDCWNQFLHFFSIELIASVTFIMLDH
jgi:hypothetical protein